MLLNKIQTAIFMELSIAKSNSPESQLHGYQIIKLIGERGINFSHQQLYRAIHKMDLNCELEPVVGKPDRKLYSLKSGVEYKIDHSKLSTDILLAYPNSEWIRTKIDSLTERRSILEREIEKLAREGKSKGPVYLVKKNEINHLGVDIIELVGALEWMAE